MDRSANKLSRQRDHREPLAATSPRLPGYQRTLNTINAAALLTRGTQRATCAQITYSPAFAFASATQHVSAVPDPTGTYGSTASLITSTAYDFNTGLVISATDANNNATTFEYNDPLYRITRINRPDGELDDFNYDDTVGNARVHTQTLQQTSPTLQTLDTFEFFDRSGRSVRSFVNEGPTYLTSDTQYDNLGRLLRVSNPYRTSAFTDPVNPSDLWTTSSYDALSRVITVTVPSGAQGITAYSAVTIGSFIGPCVMVTDPAGKARKSITDAHGRVIQVIEDPNGLAYQTNYTYDVLNKLRKVEQGSKPAPLLQLRLLLAPGSCAQCRTGDQHGNQPDRSGNRIRRSLEPGDELRQQR